MADTYDMGAMPEGSHEGSPDEELAMEGADFDMPEEEGSPVADLLSQIEGLDKDSLKELEAAIADELSKQEEDEGEEEIAEEPEAAPEGEEPEGGAGDLSALFG